MLRRCVERATRFIRTACMSDRPDVKAILCNPRLKRELFVGVIIATQTREDINTSREQAERAYDIVQAEKALGGR